MRSITILGKHIRYFVTGAVEEHTRMMSFGVVSRREEENMRHYISETIIKVHAYLGAKGNLTTGGYSDLQVQICLELLGIYNVTKDDSVDICW